MPDSCSPRQLPVAVRQHLPLGGHVPQKTQVQCFTFYESRFEEEKDISLFFFRQTGFSNDMMKRFAGIWIFDPLSFCSCQNLDAF